MKRTVKLLGMAIMCCVLANFAKAQLLGVTPSYPQIQFVNNDPTAVSYDPVSQVFSVNALPYSIDLSELDTGTLIVSNNTMQIMLNTDGTLLSGTNGFVLTGQFTEVVGGVTNNYSGVLLQGNVTAFGYQYSGLNNQFDFRINLTGGQLVSLFNCGNDVAVTMYSENSTFTGTFTNAFTGTAKGTCGEEDTTPPVVTCPPLSQVVTTPAVDTNGVSGYIITYPNPVVTDNCDPAPAIFCDTPSGSFVYLNMGDQLTVTCYGVDASGNYSDCSFTVTMGQNNSQVGSCPLAFVGTNCPAMTLSNDPGMCSATYTFTPPVATNCSGQFIATATALNEAGSAIQLTTLTNGQLQGQFPRTMTTNGNVITFTAVDGNSNSVVEQCQVFVYDKEPPTIACMNQTATFKPILTNALSCSEADFNNNCIAASNYLWFSSVIRCASAPRNCKAFTVHVTGQTIQLAVDNTNITLAVPDAYVIFSNGVAVATTLFTNGQWVTYSSPGLRGNTFISGVAWQLPFNLNSIIGDRWGRDCDRGCFRRHVNSATWCARFAVDTPGVALSWQWGAVAESQLTTNCAVLAVKPVDDGSASCWKNPDPAGACENFKPFLISGARGHGWCRNFWRGDEPDCTGILSDIERCNLGKGTACEGAVNFKTPLAADNCDNSVSVTCDPPSGSVFGPGNYTINCTAVDSSGNTNQCSFTLTVVAPLQVVFDTPLCDNIADNTAQPDAGYNDMNCPDDPSTPQYVTCFTPGDIVCHKVRLIDCNGNDVTASMASCVTVHLDVTERQGTYANSTLVNDVAQNSVCGNPGSLMVPSCGEFIYNLNTAGYQGKTVNTSKFFRSCVWVEYNSSPGVPVGMEDVILQSR